MTSTPTKEVTVDEILPLPVKVEMWVMDLCDALMADYEKQYPNSSHTKKFEATGGRKYWKILMIIIEEMFTRLETTRKCTRFSTSYR